uniref:Uncharacterized protein n=1 Tax=Strongyloides stercoralis TaxID=6248 RepID=A0A0K0ENI4_STRER
MDITIIIICIVIFIIIVSTSTGLIAYYCYKKKEKENARKRRNLRGKRKSSSSKSRSRSSSKSSSSNKKSRPSSSTKESSTTGKSRRSSRRGSSRSHDKKSSSSSSSSKSRSLNSDSKSRNRSKNRSRSKSKQSKINNNSTSNQNQVDTVSQINNTLPIRGNSVTIMSPPPQINPDIKQASLNDSTYLLPKQHNIILEKNDAPGNNQLNKFSEILPSERVELKAYPQNTNKECILEKVASNEILKQQNNVHYMQPIEDSTLKQDQEIKSYSNVTEKFKNKEAKLGYIDNSVGSLLTSNNLTYNNVNIVVNSTNEDDLNEVIKKAVNAIPDTNLKLSEFPHLLPSSSQNKMW